MSINEAQNPHDQPEVGSDTKFIPKIPAISVGGMKMIVTTVKILIT